MLPIDHPDPRLVSPRFPRSSRYNPEWVLAGVGGGANPLWLAEWLTEEMKLEEGMRILDLGCGRALSSIFLHREFGVEVWATDLWISAGENLRRICDAGVERSVFPLHADARSLPYANDFFDAVISIDAYVYFGTDDHYLNYLTRLVKPGGRIGIAGAGMTVEIEDEAPEHLRDWFTREPAIWSLHSASWWKRHWEKTGIVDVLLADTMPEGWKYWLEWHRTVCPENLLEIQGVESDAGRYLGYVRAVGCRRGDAELEEPVTALPTEYVQAPLLRGDGLGDYSPGRANVSAG